MSEAASDSAPKSNSSNRTDGGVAKAYRLDDKARVILKAVPNGLALSLPAKADDPIDEVIVLELEHK